jgi:hypothetical protein
MQIGQLKLVVTKVCGCGEIKNGAQNTMEICHTAPNSAMVQLLRDMHVELMQSSATYAGTELHSRLYAALEQLHQ